MRTLSMPSPTPAHVADAYADYIRSRATELAGKDGRLTGNEAKPDDFVADAYARAGKKRPVVESVADVARQAMLEQASNVHGGDGRVSKADAAKMSPLFARAFLELRGTKPAGQDGAAIAANLERIADGLLFMSESDDPYTAVHVKLDKSQPIDEATMKRVLTWDAEEGDVEDEYDPYPVHFNLEVRSSDDFFTPDEEHTPEEVAKYNALDAEMKKQFSETTLPNGEKAKIFTVTVTEEDSSRAPYYILGRMENGDLVGLKTWRTWT